MVITDRLNNAVEDWTLAHLIVDHVVQLFVDDLFQVTSNVKPTFFKDRLLSFSH
jgi:hypothetical protein